MTPSEIQVRQRNWADYIRTRNRPTKKCRGCGDELPNTHDYFSTNSIGRILGRCHACAHNNPNAKASHLPESCPCCGQTAKLVRDRAFAASVKVCRACLQTVNVLVTASPVTIENLMKYVQWRKEKTGA